MQNRHIARALFLFSALALAPTLVSADGVRIRGEAPASFAGMDAAGLARVDSAIVEAIRDGATPGAALAIGRRGELVRLRGYGRLDWAPGAPAVTDSTIYDLASLTKVVGTTTAVMLLIEDGRLDLDAPVREYLASWPADGPKGRITARMLLEHTSGLPAGIELWGTPGDREMRLERLVRLALQSEPGTRTLYSDAGMILLGHVVEAVAGQRLDIFLRDRVFRPLEMADTRFNPLRAAPEPARPAFGDFSNQATLLGALTAAAAPLGFFNPLAGATFFRPPSPVLERIAPTENDTYVRHRHLRGEVHDLTAAALDGVAGHAGLFSSARDLARFSQQLLDAAEGVQNGLVSPAVAREFVVRRSDEPRGLGWEFPAGRSSSGSYFSSSSFGHTGFTGTSIWIDPERDLYVVLLTNRLDPSSANQKHIALRREVHDRVQKAIDDIVIARRD